MSVEKCKEVIRELRNVVEDVESLIYNLPPNPELYDTVYEHLRKLEDEYEKSCIDVLSRSSLVWGSQVINKLKDYLKNLGAYAYHRNRILEDFNITVKKAILMIIQEMIRK